MAAMIIAIPKIDRVNWRPLRSIFDPQDTEAERMSKLDCAEAVTRLCDRYGVAQVQRSVDQEAAIRGGRL